MRALVVCLVVVTAACGGDADTAPPSPPPPDVTGLVTEVRLVNDEVVAFTVEAEGATHEILIDPQVDYGFDLRHLEEHRDGGDPVFVELTPRDGKVYAVSIVDA